MSYTSPRGTSDPRTETGSYDNIVQQDNVIPRGGYGGTDSLIPKGSFIYPKSGFTVLFYSDANGLQQIGKSKGQNSIPSRTMGELVGTSTGLSLTSASGTFIEVFWINGYVNHNWPKADEDIKEPKVGWVNLSQIDFTLNYKTPEEKEADIEDAKAAAALAAALAAAKTAGGTTSGIDSTTLGLLAVGAAFFLSKKKKKN